MKLLSLTGRPINKEVSRYTIKWNKKSRSKFQQQVKFYLQPFWKGYVVFEEFPVFGTKMTLDFLNLSTRIAVEVQGSQHSEYNKFFHGENRSNYYNQLQRDVDKKQWCKINKITLIEIYPKDLPLTKQFLEETGII